jgi:hypothetical protein
MTIEIDFAADSLTSEQQATFAADATAVYAVLDRMRRDAELPASQIKLLVADDFVTAVRGNQRDEEPFVAERPFGRVGAKNLAQDEASERVVIVFDSQVGNDRWRALGLIAHELAHPILTRARHASGVLDNVVYPSHTPTEIARSISRIGFDEYRADTIADIVLGAARTRTVDGVHSPARTWDLLGQDYWEGVREYFSGLYPQLPDLVQTYREWRLDLMSIWVEVVRQSEAIVTAFMHARAHADGADDDIAILDSNRIRSLPFVRLYLADTLPPYLNAVRMGPILPQMEEVASLDAQVVAAGESMLREIWRRLGLTFSEKTEAREFGIHVSAPLMDEGR